MKHEISAACDASRRGFLKNTGRIVAASALAGIAIPQVHAAENNTIQLAVVGTGARGSGAVANALSTKNGPIKLVAMADILENRTEQRRGILEKMFGDQIDVPKDRQFIGFDAYKKAMDCLRPGDIVILTTPPAFRWVHFDYAIQKGLHVFMEKPVTVDGPTTRKMLTLAEESTKKNLKVGVGLAVRHCKARQALHRRIQNGELGDILALRAYRMHPGYTYIRREAAKSELFFQLSCFHGFLWASGGSFSDLYIHQIDECCWMKNAWPIKALANGGRHYRDNHVDQNFDHYSVEYVFDDGARLYFYGRAIPSCHTSMSSYAQGSKGLGIVSTWSHMPGKCRIYKGQNEVKKDLVWSFPQPEPNPYQLEWDDLVDAIRQDTPYNEAKRGAEASLVTSMGRMAAHTGQVVTYDDMLNCPHEFAPDVDKLTMDSPAPLLADSNGKYPVPRPGITKQREY